MLALLVMIRAVPSDGHALSLDDVGRNVRFDVARYMPPVAEPLVIAARGPASGGGGAAAAAGPAGAAGDPKAPRRDTRRATKGPAANQDARAAERYVHESTMLAVLDGVRTGPVADVFAATPALGSAAETVLGHLVGTTIADAYGVNGLGPIGTGAGGGDTGKGTIGGGRGLGTIGLGHGPNGVGIDDRAGMRLGARQPRMPEVIPSRAEVRGGLDKEIVRRIVRQHLNEVRFCYDEALARTPTLAGRVVVQFTIAGTGKVLASVLQSSTLGSAAVESCIVGATRRWLYPAPLGGGLVSVSYPFQLAPAGG
jgi:hypothetical protein